MSWSIFNITKILYTHTQLLPVAEFVLTDGKIKKKTTGWLPCHHPNISYNLQFRPLANQQSKIVKILNLNITKKKSSRLIIQTAKRISKNKKFSPKYYTEKIYLKQAYTAYNWLALWTCCLIYTHWELQRMDIDYIFSILTNHIEHIIQKDSDAFKARFLNFPKETKIIIQKALHQMGELPYNDWEGFDERIKWYKNINTASKEKPSKHIHNVERYQDLWTTTNHIQNSKQLACHFRPNNVTIIEGSPCPSIVPKDAIIVVRNLEDAYRWKCKVDWGKICVLKHMYDNERLIELGVSDVAELEPNQTIIIAWAHLWSISKWLELSKKTPEHVTCIGRLDQWPIGEGQVFRDMILSKKFDHIQSFHSATDNIITIDSLPSDFVQKIQQKYKVVQCFADLPMENIDCGRRKFTKPYRIRTLKTKNTLFEEQRIHFPDKAKENVSVQNIRYYQGLKVSAGIYFCSEKTTPFQIHVARTHCKNALYIVECKTCLFSMQKQAPLKITINPFIN